jgi:hypothetical protein
MNAKLPQELTKSYRKYKTINDMEIGEFGYIQPEDMVVEREGDAWIKSEKPNSKDSQSIPTFVYSNRIFDNETMLLIKKTEDGFVVDNCYCRGIKWDTGYSLDHKEKYFDFYPVVEFITTNSPKAL